MGYVTPPNGREHDERGLCASTLWRFVLFLGLQTAGLQAGIEQLMQHDPSSRVHLFMGAVCPRKYRSEQRGEIVRTARRLLDLIDRWSRVFREPFFPHYATRTRFP